MVWLLVRVVGIHSLGFGIKENDQMPHSHWWILICNLPSLLPSLLLLHEQPPTQQPRLLF